MIFVAGATVSAYLLGSIPTAYIFGKLLKGIDIREHGSGNVGATNVLRTVGKGPALLVFLIDFAKGLVAVMLLPACLKKFVPDTAGVCTCAYALLGIAVVAGHIWPVFLRFRGGKGIATTAGVMAGVSLPVFFGWLIVWIIVFVIWKYVSLASIAAAVSLPLLAAVFNKGLAFILFSSALCLIGVFTHRSNIRRLIRAEESKIL